MRPKSGGQEPTYRGAQLSRVGSLASHKQTEDPPNLRPPSPRPVLDPRGITRCQARVSVPVRGAQVAAGHERGGPIAGANPGVG